MLSGQTAGGWVLWGLLGRVGWQALGVGGRDSGVCSVLLHPTASACLAAGLTPQGLGYCQGARTPQTLGQLVVGCRGRTPPGGGRRPPGGCTARDLEWPEADLESTVKARAAGGGGGRAGLRACLLCRLEWECLAGGARPGPQLCSFPPV